MIRVDPRSHHREVLHGVLHLSQGGHDLDWIGLARHLLNLGVLYGIRGRHHNLNRQIHWTYLNTHKHVVELEKS